MINNFHAFLSRFLRLDNYDFVENSVKRDIPPSIQSPFQPDIYYRIRAFFRPCSSSFLLLSDIASRFVSLLLLFLSQFLSHVSRLPSRQEKRKEGKNIEPSCPILTHLPREQRSSAAASSSLIFLSFLPILTGEMEEEEEEEGCKRVTSRLEIMFQSERIGNRDVG